MAVSLTQLSKEASRRQSIGYDTTTVTFTPIHDHLHQRFLQQPLIPPPPPISPTVQERQSRLRKASLLSYADDQALNRRFEPPFRAPKDTAETAGPLEPAMKPVAAKGWRDRASSVVEPDPLPPHSNPQALTQSQSSAFLNSSPIPPVRIAKGEVWNPQTGVTLYTISRGSIHVPKFMSSKPLLTVTRINGVPVGTVRFHTLTSNQIDLTVNGRATAISHYGLFHNRWGFAPTTGVNGGDEKWFWKKDRTTGGAKLEDSKKHGHTLARMKGDLLTFEVARLKNAMYDEVLLSAVAMAEAARRQKRNGDVVDLASAIGDFASTAEGDGGGGDGGKGGN